MLTLGANIKHDRVGLHRLTTIPDSMCAVWPAGIPEEAGYLKSKQLLRGLYATVQVPEVLHLLKALTLSCTSEVSIMPLAHLACNHLVRAN